MKLFYFLLLLLPNLFLTSIFGQDGVIRGHIFDAETGESLPGVTVMIEGTNSGTFTDFEGKFSLKANSGNYNIKINLISYEPVTINGVVVKNGDVTVIEDINLNIASEQISEVVITANEIRNTEAAMLTLKKTSTTLMDGISSAGFKKIGDSDAASSMKRVTGISVSNGKYVYVRGLGDRYTKTILNGMSVPGLDPDRNTVQMDIFPNNVIENIIVHKSFSADLPADFTGGIVDIEIIDFPEKENGKITIGGAYNNGSHFNPNFLTYDGGSTDWLGFDDGTRDIPAETNIPAFGENSSFFNSPPSGEKVERYIDILNSFEPNMAAYKEKSLMDYNISANYGNQKNLTNSSIGYNVSMSYKKTVDFYEDAKFSRYGYNTDQSINELLLQEEKTGNYGVENVLWSALGGLAYKTNNAKIGLKVLHLQNGESQAGIFDYYQNDVGSYFNAFQHNLSYSERSLTNALIDGRYSFFESHWDIEFKISPTLSKISDPDIRQTRYKVENNTLTIGSGEAGMPSRTWRNLEEINLESVINVTKEFLFLQEDAKLKFGGGHTFKERDYMIRKFEFLMDDVPLTGDPNEIFWEDNLWPMDTADQNSGTKYVADFIPNNANMYNSTVNNIAGYISTEISPIKNLNAVIGLRIENYVQRYTGKNQSGVELNDDVVLDDLGFFPGLNLIYNLSKRQNLRFSFSRTIARPSFKELSYAQIFDPISGRGFYGGLSDFKDGDGNIIWDGNLTSSYIQNYDLRWEMFQEAGQTFSISGFFKKFKDPIEMVQIHTQQKTAFQPRNVEDGEILGIELELRKNLGFMSNELSIISFNSNFTYTYSRIKLSNTEYESRVENARENQTIGKYRDMAGQAPYIVNAGLSFDGSKKGALKYLEAGFYYNMQGPTLEYVGISDRPDIYSDPFHSLNFNASYKFGKTKKFVAGLKIENIFDDKKEMYFEAFRSDNQIFESKYLGRVYSIKLTYNFF